MSNSLIFVTLTDEQIAQAKQINGVRKQITHALLCGEYGQFFGTEKQCTKYFSSWENLFKHLFSDVKSTDSYDIKDFESTFDLVNILTSASDKPNKIKEVVVPKTVDQVKKKGFWARLFG